MPGTDFARKKLKKSVEATFKKVAESTLWPSEDMVASISDLHPEVTAYQTARLPACLTDCLPD